MTALFDEALSEFNKISSSTEGHSGTSYGSSNGYEFVIWIDNGDDYPEPESDLITTIVDYDETFENMYKFTMTLNFDTPQPATASDTADPPRITTGDTVTLIGDPVEGTEYRVHLILPNTAYIVNGGGMKNVDASRLRLAQPQPQSTIETLQAENDALKAKVAELVKDLSNATSFASFLESRIEKLGVRVSEIEEKIDWR